MSAVTMEERTDFAAPSNAARWRELRAGWDALRLVADLPRLRSVPRGDGRAVVLVPGLGTNDVSLLPLRGFLARRGHDARPWGLGTNTGDVDGLLERLEGEVGRVVAETGRPVNIAGWSLGGILARETARDRPDLVHRVATFGTPLRGPRYTAARRLYPDDELARIEAMIDERTGRPIDVPVTAIYSRNDGIVDWRTCADDTTPGAVNVEVSSSHFGLGVDPEVWSHLAHWFAPTPDTTPDADPGP